VQQSVKDVNQQLVDEGIVQTDKLGIGNFYWLFASQTFNLRQTRTPNKSHTDNLLTFSFFFQELEKIQSQLAAIRASNADLAQRVDEQKREASNDSVSPEERAAKMARLSELEALDGAQQTQLRDLAELDPDTLVAMQKDTAVAVEAANRWTDAVNTLSSQLRNQFNVPAEAISEKYGVPADLDYV
jgi:hypothetical protein